MALLFAVELSLSTWSVAAKTGLLQTWNIQQFLLNMENLGNSVQPHG